MKLNFLLILVIIILIFSTIRGYKKGLFGIIFGVLAWIFMGVFVFYGTPKMLVLLENNASFKDQIETKVEAIVAKKIDDMSIDSILKQAENMGLDTENNTTDDLAESYGIPENILKGLSQDKDDENISDYIKESVKEKANSAEDEIKSEVVKAITEKVTAYVIKGLAFFFTVLIAAIIIFIVSIIIKIIENIKGVKTVSHGLGLVFGLLEGFLLVFIILYIISCLSLFTGTESALKDINSNDFLSYLYNHNPIFKLLSKM